MFGLLDTQELKDFLTQHSFKKKNCEKIDKIEMLNEDFI